MGNCRFSKRISLVKAAHSAAWTPRWTLPCSRLLTTPDLRLLNGHCYRRLYTHTQTGGLERWPELFDQLGDLGGLFYLLVALTMVPMVKDTHAKLRVAEQITRDTCLQIRDFNKNHKPGRDGRPGILVEQLPWLRNYPLGRLFRLGRFEYLLQNMPARKTADQPTGIT